MDKIWIVRRGLGDHDEWTESMHKTLAGATHKGLKLAVADKMREKRVAGATRFWQDDSGLNYVGVWETQLED